MEDKIVLYEVELDRPDAFVCFEAPDNLKEHEILNRACEELTRNTRVWFVNKKELNKI